MTDKTIKDYSLETLAAGALGDVWLSADGAAIALGLFTPAGLPSRRRFLETVACRPDFPAGFQIGNETKWRKSALMAWAEEQARLNRAA